MKVFDTKSRLKKHLLLCHQATFATDDCGSDCIDKIVTLKGRALEKKTNSRKKNRHHKCRRSTQVDTEPSPAGESAMQGSSTPASAAWSVDRDWDPLLCQGANQHPGDISVVVTNTGDFSEGSVDFSSGKMTFPSISSEWMDYLNLHCFDANNEVASPSLAVQITEPPIVDVSPPGSALFRIMLIVNQ